MYFYAIYIYIYIYIFKYMWKESDDINFLYLGHRNNINKSNINETYLWTS